MSSKKADSMLLLVAIFGGAGFIGMKYLLEWEYSTFQIIAGRFLVSSLCMLILFYKHLKGICKYEIKAGFVMGLLLFGLFYFMTVSLKVTTPSVNAFMTNTQAVMVPFIGWILFREKPDKYIIIAACMTVIGIALLSIEDNFYINLGAFIALMASFCYGVQLVFTSHFCKKCNPIVLTIVENITVFLLSFLVSFLSHNSVPFMEINSIIVFIGLGVLCTCVCFLLQTIAQKYTTASKAGIIISTEAVFTTIFSVVFYGERLQFHSYIGCIILFCAVILAETKLCFIQKKLNYFKIKC